MRNYLRVIILLVVLFGTVALARNQIAWAATSPETTDQSPRAGAEQSVSAAKGDDECDLPQNKDKSKCKCKKKQCGTVKPPPKKLLIPVTGDFSVGGLCTVSLTEKAPDVQLEASVVAPLPQELPEALLPVDQGCLLEYQDSDVSKAKVLAVTTRATICFASPPDQQATIYYFDTLASQPEWIPLETTADAGIACAPADESGVYAATVTKP